jgi:hypothetical protein
MNELEPNAQQQWLWFEAAAAGYDHHCLRGEPPEISCSAISRVVSGSEAVVSRLSRSRTIFRRVS